MAPESDYRSTRKWRSRVGNPAPASINKKERAMAKGKVKWYNDSKGFGFITNDDGSEDIFVHYSAIIADRPSKRTLKEKDKVSFEIENSTRGLRAVNVKRI